MKKILSLAMSVLVAGVAYAADLTFDQRISEARLHMRAACQAVQKLSKAAAGEHVDLKEVAAFDVANARKLWSDLVKDFSSTIPEGYAGDPMWAFRLEDVRLDLVRMQKEIAEGEWRLAFLSCAHACNWITTMHEANGVTLAIDTMAALRKKVGFARGLLAAGKPDKARALIKEILAARDAVLLTPPPVTSNQEAYLEALPELSHSADVMAEAIRLGRDIKPALDGLILLVERVYELAI